MTPLRIGPEQRQLFAIHHPPEDAARHDCVLLCNPFGQEAIRCHRLFRVLAEQLPRHGFAVMRFDYYGTGDSAGDDGEGEIEGWRQDVLAADAELRRRHPHSSVSWVGLRLGASIAALASQGSARPLKRLLLWDPVIEGAPYLTALFEAHLAACRDSFGARWAVDAKLRERVQREAHSEALGFALSVRLRRQLEQLSAPALAMAEAQQIALLAAPGWPALDRLEQHLRALAKAPSLTLMESNINWLANETMGASIAPGAVLQAMIALLKTTSEVSI